MQCAKVPLNISGVLYVLACMLSLCLACLLCADVRTSKHFPPAKKENKNFVVGWATVFGIQNKVRTLSNVVVVVVKFCVEK